MRCRLISVATLFFFSLTLLPAQEEGSANFVEDFNSTNHLRTGLRFKDYKVNFSNDNASVFEFTNTGLNTFIGGRYGKIGLSLSLPVKSFGAPPNEQSKRIAGNIHLYQKRWYLHLTGQSLQGFTQKNLSSTSQPEIFRADIRFKRIGVYGFWIKNNGLSLRASFKHNQRQIDSQGSWLLATTINFHNLLSDSITVPLALEDSFSFNRFQQLKIGAGVGYAYTWVFLPQYYLTPVVVLGPELRLQNYRAIGNNSTSDRLNLSPRLRGRLAIGYNGNRYFYSLTGYWLPGYDVGNQFNTRVEDLQLSFTFGYRFAEP
jgi:hypothetical protein